MARLADHVQVRQRAVALVEIEAVADEELVGDDEADVAHGQVVHQPPVGTVEERRCDERGRLAKPERLAEVAQGQPRVDDVLDDDQVAAFELGVEILEQADSVRAARLDAGPVAGQLDEVDGVDDRQRAREVGEEDQARLQRADEQRLAAGVVARDLGAELTDACRELLGGEVDVAEPWILVYEAIGSLNRSARRATSRL